MEISPTLLLVIVSSVLIFLVLLVLFLLKRNVSVSLEGHVLVLKYPLRTRRVDLDQELQDWKVQQAYYIRWGRVYAINLLLTDGKRASVSSLFNPDQFERLHQLLDSQFAHRRVAG